MSISRCALLISNAGESGEEHYCKGVLVDIQNYKTFLASPVGGWWSEDRIIWLDRPTKSRLRESLRSLAEYDYSFIAFSGHGWFSKADGATVLRLRRGEDISSLELEKDVTKRTIVLDCCREIQNESALLERREKYAEFSAELNKRSPDGKRCREKFFEDVMIASPGIVTLHSCSPGETAGDDERTGGHYTSRLVVGANVWADEISNNVWSNTAQAYSVVAAHTKATNALQARYNGRQKPWIDKPRTEQNYFPFAVFS